MLITRVQLFIALGSSLWKRGPQWRESCLFSRQSGRSYPRHDVEGQSPVHNDMTYYAN